MKTRKPRILSMEVIASPENYKPSHPDLRVIGAFNPGVTQVQTSGDLETVLWVRVAETHKDNYAQELERYDQPRIIHAPRFHIANEPNTNLQVRFDEYDPKQIATVNKKEVKLKEEETIRLRHISLPRILRIDESGNVLERQQTPTIYPTWEFERFGIEDVRITLLEDGRHALTYVCPHRDFGVSTRILTTRDFRNYEDVNQQNTGRPTLIGMKDVIIFPEKIPSPSKTESVNKGKPIYVAYTRPNAFPDLSKPGNWISYSPDLSFWGLGHRLNIARDEISTGPGTSPIKRNDRWIAVYHETTRNERGEVVYKAKLMSTKGLTPWEGLKTSRVVLERSDTYDLLPLRGYVPNVIFPTGLIEKNGIATIISGVDDTWTIKTTHDSEELFEYLEAA